MKVIGIIVLGILGISLLLLTCMGLYALWFMAFPEFINKIKNKKKWHVIVQNVVKNAAVLIQH